MALGRTVSSIVAWHDYFREKVVSTSARADRESIKIALKPSSFCKIMNSRSRHLIAKLSCRPSSASEGRRGPYHGTIRESPHYKYRVRLDKRRANGRGRPHLH